MRIKERGCGAHWAISVTVLVLLIVLQPASLNAQLDASQAKSLIAMVKAKTDQTPARVGAGIIVGHEMRRLYVATSSHLFPRSENNHEAVLEFTFAPGETFSGRLLNHEDRTLDLTVLKVVVGEEMREDLDDLPYASLGDVDQLVDGDLLSLIGNPNSQAWHVSSGLYQFRRQVGQRIEFEPYPNEQGYSGGGLFDEDWLLLGMMRRVDPPLGVTMHVDAIIDRLREWNYPVLLSEPRPEPGPIVDGEVVEPSPRASLTEEIDTALGKAQRLVDNGNYEKALREISDLTEFAPRCTPCQILKARVHAKLGEGQSALRAYDAAIESAPEDTDVITEKSALLIKLRHYGQAIELLERLLANEDWNNIARYNLALAYLRNRQFLKAEQAYEIVKLSGREDLYESASLGLGIAVFKARANNAGVARAKQHLQEAICGKYALLSVLKGRSYSDPQEDYRPYVELVQEMLSGDSYRGLLAELEVHRC